MRLKFSERNSVGPGSRATRTAKKTLYDFLGVDPGVDAQTLKRAFRKTVKEYHPDLHAGDLAASQRTKSILAAYEVLSDPEQRDAYDQYLAQLCETPLPSQSRRRMICGASIAVCVSFALVSAWKFSITPTLINQVTAATQDRGRVEPAAKEPDAPQIRNVTEGAQVATDASSGAATALHAISAGDSESNIAEPETKASQLIDPGPSDDIDRVIADLDRAIQRAPEDAQAYRKRGNAWSRKGDAERALADYQQAIRINPNDPAIFHERGLMWQRKGELDKALADFDRSIRMSFSDAEVYSDRGAAWFVKGSYDRALADFNQALKINPGLATAYVRRAAVFERKGDQERVRADSEQAARLGGAGNAVAAPNTPAKKIADSPSNTGISTYSSSRTIFDQVTAATAVAERLTAATSVAILIARPEIKSISDLAGKSIAIDTAKSTYSSSIRTAIVVAGAAEVQLTESHTSALDRVINEEMPAAVLTLASPEAAEGFPEIAGFKIFRIPITPGMSPVRIQRPQPATNATAASNAASTKIANLLPKDAATDTSLRTIQELVTAATALAERTTVAVAVSQGAPPTTSNQIDSRIAILIARPEIKSMSDLTGKAIAIDDRLLELSRNIEIAMTAAGATEVRVNQPEWKPSEPVIDGAVPAAVLTLVSREAADAFPEIPGFRIFRIPLSPSPSTIENSPDRSR
jgi:curved DNA-binding protein CbpA